MGWLSFFLSLVPHVENIVTDIADTVAKTNADTTNVQKARDALTALGQVASEVSGASQAAPAPTAPAPLPPPAAAVPADKPAAPPA